MGTIFQERVYNNRRYKLQIRRPPSTKSGKKFYQRRVRRSLKNVDVFLVCGSISDSQSQFKSCVKEWVHRIRWFRSPFVVVGTSDNKKKNKRISHESHSFADRIGATDYVECSPLSGDCGANGVNLVFQRAVEAVVRSQSTQQSHNRNRSKEILVDKWADKCVPFLFAMK